MLNLEQITAFIAAAEKGSFSAAARHLGKSQSSVSIGVNNLELDLGVTLFDRSTKYPKLTAQGERVYEQSKVLLRQAERIHSFAQGTTEDVEDVIRIGIDPLVPLSVIDSALEKMAQRFPFTQVQLLKLSGEKLNSAILNGEIDLALNLGSKAVPDNLEFVAVEQIEWVCVCSPDSDFSDMSEVDNETLIAERQIVCTSMLENSVLNATSKLSQEIWQAADLDDMVRLVEQGLGWAFLPKSMAIERQAMGTLIEFQPEFQRAELYYAADLLWRANSHRGPVFTYLNELLTAKKI
ncbi:LysR family transcriptional regulator [Vibrio sinaloensis]|uniref:LysR family transcriptional regulator n=1 Tax=Photobacterium sp. (strain ATCC 43367) TaxID=379097 RepID=UPI002047EB50|nr:LysR family transcriptional regulator [Vibrio sinaloensis]UPQ89455.1 LysR family transcriptional regulator [Vibrio sinaloensis]